MRRARLFALLALGLAASCSSRDHTRIVVAVWSDLVVPTELDTIRIDVFGPTGTSSDSFALTTEAEAGKTRLPAQLQLEPTGAKDATFTVTAVGLHAQVAMVSQSARVAFVPGKALLLKLFLGRACENVTCPAEYTCSAGACGQPVAVINLPPYDPSKPLLGPDAGPGPDTRAPSDARVVDATTPDLPAIETGVVDTGRIPDVPLGSGGSGGTGGVSGTGGTTGMGGIGGGSGTTSLPGTGGAPSVDAPTASDVVDVPIIVGDGAAVDGGGQDTGGLDATDAGTPDVVDAISSDASDVPLQTCVLGSSRLGSCALGP